MRALLIHPTLSYPEPDAEAVKASMTPLVGVNTLAGVLRQHGVETEILDPFLYYLSRVDAGESFAAMAGRLTSDLEPDMVCVSVVSHLRGAVAGLLRDIKRLRPRALTVVGGVHVTDAPGVAVRQFGDVADMVVAGPGEGALAALARCHAERSAAARVPGLLSRNEATIPAWAAGTEYAPPGPIPAPDATALPDYRRYAAFLPSGDIPRAIVCTTRGCPYACRFCSAASVQSGRPWAMPPDVVLAHLCHLKETYGVQEVSFHDETFLQDGERATRIFELMARQALVFDDIYLHTTIASLDRAPLAAYRRAGGRRLFVGLESGSERIRSEMRKPFAHVLSNAGILERVRLCRDEGIEVGAFVIVGWPEERGTDRDETRRLLEDLRPSDLQTSVLKIYPGTDIYRRALREGRIRENDWLEAEPAYFPYVKGDELGTAMEFARELERLYQTYRIRKAFESQGDRYSGGSRVCGDAEAWPGYRATSAAHGTLREPVAPPA